MSNKTTNNYGGGVSFCSLLAILFIALKLLGKIDWSWLWILAPLWIPLAIVLGVLVFIGIGALIAFIITSKK